MPRIVAALILFLAAAGCKDKEPAPPDLSAESLKKLESQINESNAKEGAAKRSNKSEPQ